MDLFSVPESPSSFRRNVLVVGREHAIVEFAKSNNFIEKRGSKSTGTTSHHMYGGIYGLGRLCVPQAETRRLAEAVVRDFSYGVYSALTENKPHGIPTRFYIDYDFMFATLAEARDAEKLWLHVLAVQQEELAGFFPDQVESSGFFDCMVLSGGLIETTNPMAPYKAGVHVIFQRVFVTVDMALYITAHIIHRLEREYRGSADEGAWAKRIDQNVYAEGRGLRWAWQLKTKSCQRCKGAGYKSGCTSCGNGEIIDENASMYVPVYMCRGVFTLTREAVACRRDTPTIELLIASSIRAVSCTEPSYGFTLYPGHLPLPVFKRNVSVAPCGDATRQTRSSDDLVLKTDDRFALISVAVRRMHKEYAGIEIQKIAIRAKGFAVAVLGIGSCYCMNYGKDHSKQRVNFFVGRYGVTQSCYCKCDVVRSSGVRCREYTSPKAALTALELHKLFPAAKASSASASASALESVASAASNESLRVSDADFFKPTAEESAAMRQAIAKANSLARSSSELMQQYTDRQLDELVGSIVFKAKPTRARRLKRLRDSESKEGEGEGKEGEDDGDKDEMDRAHV